MIKKFTILVAVAFCACNFASAQLISEFQPNANGTDPDPMTIELSGTPSEAFSGFIISVEGDATSGPGTVQQAEAVTGTFDANGLLQVTIADLENPTFTLFLTATFTGVVNTTDIDSDDDGTAEDLSTFGTIYDAIGIPDAVGDETFIYGTDGGGQDFAYTGDEPQLVFRDASVGAWYAINDPDNGAVFDINASDVTPGVFDVNPITTGTTFGSINPSRPVTNNPEPTNQLTNLTEVRKEFDSFLVSWTDADPGTQEPLGYLFIISDPNLGPAAVPVDGTETPGDNDLSDGFAAIYVSYESDDELNLLDGTELTTYNVVAYSYTNSGDNINYKTDNAPSISVSTNSEIYSSDFEGITSLYNLSRLSIDNVSGTNRWERGDFSSDNFAEITEFGGEGDDEEDWMVLGPINMDAYSDETFSFTSQANFLEGTPLTVKVSTDFDGDVQTATWSDLTVSLSTGGFEEVYSGLIDVSAVNGQAYIAFAYQENTTTGFEANGIYQIDDVKFSGTRTSTTVPLPALSSASTDLFIESSVATTGDVITNDFGIIDGEELVISTGNTVIVYGDVALGGQVTVQSGGAFIHYGEALDAGGSFTISRSTTFGESEGRYSVMGGTTSGANTSDIGSIIYSYNETTDYGADGLARFEAVSAGQSMTPGIGYFTANTGDVTFSGIPNTGGYVVEASKTGSAATAGFNLVANPYTSAIDFDDFIDINDAVIEGSIYIWDDGGSDEGRRTNADYITVNAMGVASGGSSRASDWDGNIRSGQGFFVKVPSDTIDGTYNVAFTNAMRTVGNNLDGGFFRQESNTSNDIVRLSINREDLSSDMLIGFRADATVGKDRLYDAAKFSGNTDLQIYSLIGQDAYAIQGLPLLEGGETELNLGFDAGESGVYVIKADEINIPAGYSVYLIDNQLGLTTNLSEVKSYTYTTTETESNKDRFALAFRNSEVTSVIDQVTEKLLVYTDAEHVNVTLENGEAIDQFTVYTLSGQVLVSDTNDQEVIKLKKNVFSTGVNIIKAESGSSSYTIKFILD